MTKIFEFVLKYIFEGIFYGVASAVVVMLALYFTSMFLAPLTRGSISGGDIVSFYLGHFFTIFGSSDSPTINQLGPWSLSTSLLNVFFSSLNFLVVNCCFPGDLHLTHVCFCFRKKRNLKSGLECSSARFNFLFTKNTKRELNFFY